MVCPTCKGSGQVQRAGGRLRFAQECPDCEGTGSPPLSLFVMQRQRHVAQNGNGEGAYTCRRGNRVSRQNPRQRRRGRLGAPAGDLHIITNVGTHKYFTRKGDNIYVTVPITVPEAALRSKDRSTDS